MQTLEREAICKAQTQTFREQFDVVELSVLLVAFRLASQTLIMLGGVLQGARFLSKLFKNQRPVASLLDQSRYLGTYPRIQ